MRSITSAGRRPARPGARCLSVAGAASAAGAAIVLAGCGSAVGGHAGQAPAAAQGQPPAIATTAPAAAHLCPNARTLDQVTVRLTGARAGEILPRAVTIMEAARVRALATALCGLPDMPRGVRPCPMARPGGLRLEFTAGRQAYRPVLIRDSGCASVTGAGPARQWAWSSRPGRLLGAAAGSHGRLTPSTHPSSVPVG